MNESCCKRATHVSLKVKTSSWVQYFVDDCTQRLVDYLEERAEELALLRTPQRVRLALQARLEMLIPFIGAP